MRILCIVIIGITICGCGSEPVAPETKASEVKTSMPKAQQDEISQKLSHWKPTK